MSVNMANGSTSATSLSHLQLHPGRHHDGPEGERVGADGGEHDGRHRGVDHGGTSSNSICGAARGGGDDETCGGWRVGGEWWWYGCGSNVGGQ